MAKGSGGTRSSRSQTNLTLAVNEKPKNVNVTKTTPSFETLVKDGIRSLPHKIGNISHERLAKEFDSLIRKKEVLELDLSHAKNNLSHAKKEKSKYSFQYSDTMTKNHVNESIDYFIDKINEKNTELEKIEKRMRRIIDVVTLKA